MFFFSCHDSQIEFSEMIIFGQMLHRNEWNHMKNCGTWSEMLFFINVTCFSTVSMDSQTVSDSLQFRIPFVLQILPEISQLFGKELEKIKMFNIFQKSCWADKRIQKWYSIWLFWTLYIIMYYVLLASFDVITHILLKVAKINNLSLFWTKTKKK